MLIAEEKAIWDARRPLAEAEKKLLAKIDKAAVAPGVGGFVRGSSIGHRGQQVATNPEIAWPRERPGLDAMETYNAPGLLAWLFKDELKAAAIKELRSKYTDEGTIPAADKPALLAAIATKIWHQRRVCESAYQYARLNGVKDRNRPRGTPTEILLDVLPWKNGASIVVDRAPTSDESPEDADFQQDDFDNADEE